MDKRRYLSKRVINALLTIVLVASFNFVLFRILPGDPARFLLPRGRWEETAIEKQRAVFHLDRPLYEQFAYYWADTARLRFGDSFQQKRAVTSVVGERIWPTVLLVGVGSVFAIVVGMITGVTAGWRRRGVFDVFSTNMGMVLYSIPTLWLGLMFIMFFSVRLGWFPVGRMSEAGMVYAGWWDQLASTLHHLFLPALTFGLVYVGQYHLIIRNSVIGVKNEDFALTARAKGLRPQAVLWQHVVPNALLPTVTVIMMNLGFVFSGAILTETVFNWPGLGLLSYDAMTYRDYPVLQGVFLIASIAVIFANLVADIMYYYLDPRVQA